MASKKKRCHCVWAWSLLPIIYLFAASYLLQDLPDYRYNPWWEFPVLIMSFVIGIGTVIFAGIKIAEEYE